MADSRADKWLWATRFFKTRAQAAKACTAGKVKRAGHPVKPAADLKIDDVLEIPFPEGPGVRTIRVKTTISLRVGAPLARECYEDLTPPEVYAHLKQVMAERRQAGLGRPTKRERRQIGRVRGFWD
ncbi:RNA-binding S4 domain-containing protein [Luteolibacter pohnpeiensis]|uniref:RNA-binding S4 domain-containing protein n=1 Tax=Luteolibacter pohnpeiensis TaxID=454153 RepID=A0A934VV93_9BACT|nr:RNA-binding S4 domain-containing protein [Luteolibacter pohnpeiensis]MBK1881945.1 RNA-binding S4 domain-containing protein [Luteolibacter pohnpeiensis]